MSYSAFPKGSEWRKWDLQVQTILDDNYISLSEYYAELKKKDQKHWQQYCAKVGGEANALLFDSKRYFNDAQIKKEERCRSYTRNLFAFLEVFNPDLACIGITDHNYFDDILIDTLVEFSASAHCRVIPGVEINCSGVHVLLLFHEIPCEQNTFSEGIRTLLKRFGINNRKNEAGVLTTLSKDLKHVIDEAKKEGAVIIFPHCNSDNGLFQERGKTDRTHLADLFNHQTMNLLQSQNRQGAIAVADYITKNKHLRSKFCCHISSDARALRDIGRCDPEGNFLWIKADPTFDGLKQIIYEPDLRIVLGTEKPEEKKSYLVIDSVRFLDNTQDVKFSSDAIEINQNLTTIIGGKSTGKSLLLYYVAKTVDPQEVEYRTNAIEFAVEYDFDKHPDFNFEVTWKDGQRRLLKVAEGTPDEESTERKILYIPQKYLNTLSEANINSREALNQFVLNVILQDAAMREKHEEAISEIKAAWKNLPPAIAELFSQQEEIRKAEEEVKQMGDEKGIQKYIEPLQKQVEQIKEKAGFTEEQSKTYETLTAKEKDVNTQVSNLNEDKKTVKELEMTLINEIKGLRVAADESEEYLNDQDIRKTFKQELNILETFGATAKASIKNVQDAIDGKIKRLNSDLAKVKAELAPLLAKVQLQTDLQEKTDAIKKEQKKLNAITIKRNAIKTKQLSYKKKADAVIEAYKQIVAKYDALRTEFKKIESKFGDISLSVVVAFKDAAFNQNVVAEYLNKKDLKRAIPESQWGEEFIYRYDSTKHISNMTLVFDGLLNGSISSVKGRPAKDAVAKLLEDYFYLDFRIFYKNDSLDKMSPGKKGLVLLQLLIDLSDEEWPILLDQPEDDLDNRSVYEDLVGFLKKKKNQRQIIIVTHNPNLVVGADAEEIVVANQDGQDVGRDNKKFRFEYVSGALENSFEVSAKEEAAILPRKGIRQHVCEILEGGREAFQKREQKYNFPEMGS